MDLIIFHKAGRLSSAALQITLETLESNGVPSEV